MSSEEEGGEGMNDMEIKKDEEEGGEGMNDMEIKKDEEEGGEGMNDMEIKKDEEEGGEGMNDMEIKKDEEPTEYTDSAMSDAAKHFMSSFKKGKSYPYVEQIDKMMGKGLSHIKVDYRDTALYNISPHIIKDPDRAIPAFRRGALEILRARYGKYADSIKDRMIVRFTNVDNEKNIMDVDEYTCGELVLLRGIISGMSDGIYLKTIKAVYRCDAGHRTIIEKRERDYFKSDIKVPIVCANTSCKARTFEMDEGETEDRSYRDSEIIQDPADAMEYNSPFKFQVILPEELKYEVTAGDRVTLTAIPKKMPPKNKFVTSRTIALLVNNVETITDSRIGRKDLAELTETDILQLRDAAKKSEHMGKLIASIAPHIKGKLMEKEAVLLALVGGSEVIKEDGSSKTRGDINVLLCGDPGTAKSQLLLFAVKVASKSYYLTGGMASGPGLSASVVRGINNNYMIYPGAAVMADRGLLVIDEFDKLKPEDRGSLHEIMEQQTVSIAKAQNTGRLNARCAVICAANPLKGKYNPYDNLNENIGMPIPLLTRFDLIFVMRDLADRDKDGEIFKRMASNYSKDSTKSHRGPYDFETVAKHIWQSRQMAPEMSDDAEEMLNEHFVEMRALAGDEDSAILFSNRYGDAIIRISSAYAKIRGSSTIELEDVDNTKKMMDHMLKSAAIDVNTGKIDYGVLQGTPSSGVGEISLFMDVLKGLEDSNPNVPIKHLTEEMIKSGKWVDEVVAMEFIKRMARDSVIYYPSPGKVRRTSA